MLFKERLDRLSNIIYLATDNTFLHSSEENRKIEVDEESILATQLTRCLSSAGELSEGVKKG